MLTAHKSEWFYFVTSNAPFAIVRDQFWFVGVKQGVLFKWYFSMLMLLCLVVRGFGCFGVLTLFSNDFPG
jgi:hypothetical protein